MSLQLAHRMSQLGTETAFEVLAKAKALEAQGRSIVHLHIGAPDFRTPENIVEAGRKALKDGYHSYTPAKGLIEVREAVCEDIAKNRKQTVHPDQVMIVPGGKPTMFFAIMMFGEEGTEIIYPNPGFPIYESMIKFSGAKPVPMELEEASGFCFDADKVLAKINSKTRLLILNTPANPTGGVVPRSELKKLADGLEKFPGVYVLADEIYSRLLYDGAEHVTFLEFEALRERTILLDGWSKTYAMTGWRLGYGVWPKHLIADAERLQINSNSCTNAVAQVAGIEALRGPQTAVDTMRAAFFERRAIIVEELNGIPGFSCLTPGGAFYAFANTSGTGLCSRELEDLFLNEAGVATIAGTSFGHLGEGYMRFSYANSIENIREGMRRVRESLQPA
ncbi:MAG TPA: pyridoxal phosphate-dependent aminotransferase [Planctomycetes bacterium]|nr:pyridoxal phosphate-dependent aminotransferase [Planctomycetota bacterium]HIL52137.1 pyridoxal phosphate-dependent aminotransferase [Planctomycetota bacterium]